MAGDIDSDTYTDTLSLPTKTELKHKLPKLTITLEASRRTLEDSTRAWVLH